MASVQVKNGRYYFVYRDPADGKQRWEASGISVDPKNPDRSKQAAIMKLGAREAEGWISEADPSRPKRNAAKIQLADYLNEWLPKYKKTVRMDTYEGCESVVRFHLVPYFQEHPVSLAALNQTQLQAYFDEKGATLSYGSLKRHKTTLSVALTAAIDEGLIATKACMSSLRLAKTARFEANVLDTKQTAILLERCMSDSSYPAIYLAAKLGLRRSEVIGLRWSAIDFDTGYISINHTAIETKKNVLMFSDNTKTDTSNRKLKMTAKVEEYLKGLKLRQEENRKFLGDKYDTQYTGYVCLRDNGRIIRPDRASLTVKKRCRECGLPQIRFHDLRHSFATNLIHGGADIKAVSKILGHSNVGTTMSIYYHVLDKDIDNVLDELDNRMAV